MKAFKLVGFLICTFVVATAVDVAAQAIGTASTASATGTALVPQMQNNIAYVTGGVGKDEQELAEAIRRDGYNVHLVFAEQQTGAYVSDVKVRITDGKGNTVLNVVSDGPMLLAKLPPGHYQISADLRGQTKTASVDAGSGTKKLTMLWPSTVDKQGNAMTLDRQARA